MQPVHRVCAFSNAKPGLMGSAAYRAYWPLGELNKRRDFENCLVVTEDGLSKLLARRQLHRIQGYDLYIIQRMPIPPQGARALVNGLHGLGGKAVVFDVDDDLTNQYRDLGYDGWMEATVAACDAVTVSTPALGKIMERCGKPVFVLPNHLSAEHFAETSLAVERVFDELVIGTVSGQTKWGDLLLVADALKRIAQDYPEITIACAGYRPPYFESIEGLQCFAPVEFRLLPGLYRQFDIVLCPLDAEDLFNHSKSAIGALQAMAAARPVGKGMGGAIPVVSGNLPVYRRAVNHRHNGLVVKNGEWYEAIAQLIEDRALRERLSVQALRWVKKHRNIDRVGPLWAKAYQTTLRGA